MSTATQTIVWDFRLARVLLAALTGAGISRGRSRISGIVSQSFSRPFIIGASGGAALGATLAITLGWTAVWLGFGGRFLWQLLEGALLAVALAYTISEMSGQTNILALLLAGTALSSAFSAGVSLLMVLNDDSFVNVFFWLLGGFSGRSWDDLRLAYPIS